MGVTWQSGSIGYRFSSRTMSDGLRLSLGSHSQTHVGRIGMIGLNEARKNGFSRRCGTGPTILWPGWTWALPTNRSLHRAESGALCRPFFPLVPPGVPSLGDLKLVSH